MIQYVLPALLALSVSAAALDLDHETEKRLFPKFGNASDMRQVIKFEVIVSQCPEVKRGPNAGMLFRLMLTGRSVTPPYVPDCGPTCATRSPA